MHPHLTAGLGCQVKQGAVATNPQPGVPAALTNPAFFACCFACRGGTDGAWAPLHPGQEAGGSAPHQLPVMGGELLHWRRQWAASAVAGLLCCWAAVDGGSTEICKQVDVLRTRKRRSKCAHKSICHNPL